MLPPEPEPAHAPELVKAPPTPPPVPGYVLPDLRPPSPRYRGPLDRVSSPIYVRSLTGSTQRAADVLHQFEATASASVRIGTPLVLPERISTPPEQFKVVHEEPPRPENEDRMLSEYESWKQSAVPCSPEASARGTWASRPSTTAQQPEQPLAPAPPTKWVRPIPGGVSPTVIHELKPVFPGPARRPGGWNPISASWESDGAAKALLIRLGREKEPLLPYAPASRVSPNANRHLVDAPVRGPQSWQSLPIAHG